MHIGEAITVTAVFGAPYKIKPIRFEWSGRTLEISEITYRWQSRDGAAVLHHFNVMAGGALYELTFDSSTLNWRLESLEA